MIALKTFYATRPITDEQIQLIIVEVFGRKITDDRYKVFKRIIQEIIAAELLARTIEGTALEELWLSKNFNEPYTFKEPKVKELLDVCLKIYAHFPDFFYRIPIKVSPYLRAIARKTTNKAPPKIK